MIYVAGVPFSPPDDSLQELDTLTALMGHPVLVSASNSFSSMDIYSREMLRMRKCVYVFQREFATVDPTLVELVGTDEATTCVGVVIRNCRSGMTSVAHLDFPKVVDVGLSQMLPLVADENSDDFLDVHIVGGFDDTSSQLSVHDTNDDAEIEGYSYPLCAKIIETLMNRSENFQIQTLHILGLNTRCDADGIARPIFHGFVVETSTGSISPANFDETSRCPDEIVRRIRLSASFEDPSSTGRLLETYDTKSDQFVIAPCVWTTRQSRIALALQDLSDTEILLTCSTSPFAENPDFVDNERRKWEYLIRHPDWSETFPSRRPRVFQRTADGNWVKL